MYTTLLSTLFLVRYGAGLNVKNNRQAYWFVLIGLFIFSAFRFRVGCDWGGYYYNFIAGQDLLYAEVISYREPLWWLIQIAFNRWDLPYPSVNLLTSAIFFAGIHSLAVRQPDRLGFLVLLFPILVINMPMSGIRQAATIGFLCFAFCAFIDKRPLRFVIWILVGSTVHSSILFFLLLSPMAIGFYNRRRVLAAILLAVPGAYFMSQTETFQVATDRYIDTGVEAFGSVFRVGMLSMTGLFYLFVLRRKWKEKSPSDYGLAYSGAFLMLALLPIVGIGTVIADRIGYYLVPIQMMILARIPFLGFRSNRAFLTALPYIGLLIAFSVWSLNSNIFRLCYVPYESWLFGNDDFGLQGF